MKRVRLSRQFEELVARLLHVRGLRHPLARKLEHLVGADHEVRAVLADARGFRHGEGERQILRACAGIEQRLFGRTLVERRRHHDELEPGILKQRPAGAARGSEDQAHAGFRAARSATTAAAVSSIERRVTSMTGQP